MDIYVDKTKISELNMAHHLLIVVHKITLTLHPEKVKLQQKGLYKLIDTALVLHLLFPFVSTKIQ
ncbi:unnamed protein product [Brugia timori]|uniref:Ovule protein n=1 Tax=Brugia timori TaxID=42155 RepID=A0A0R3RDA9_9BILA|nr:unnamed protein product [Brugia timori]